MSFLDQNKWLVAKQYIRLIEIIYRQGIIDACKSQDTDAIKNIIDLEYGYDTYIIYSEFYGRRINISIFMTYLMSKAAENRLNVLLSYLNYGKLGSLKKSMAYICFEFYKEGLNIGLKMKYEDLDKIEKISLDKHIIINKKIEPIDINMFIHIIILKIQNFILAIENCGLDNQIKECEKLTYFITDSFIKERERIWIRTPK